MNVEKISVKKISESVVEQIEKMIESGTFEPGDKLPSVRELCDKFGVGRTAVRDAIITLKGKGMVDVKQGEGTFICEFDTTRIFNQQWIYPHSEDIKKLFQVRKVLETGIAENAAMYRSDEDIQKMKNILSSKSVTGWESDYNFHMAIAQSTRNDIITQLMQFISTTTKKAMNDFHTYIQNQDSIVTKIDEQHFQIFEAIKNQESQTANLKMREHLDYVEELLQDCIVQETSLKVRHNNT